MLVIMLVLGFHSGIVEASAHEDGCAARGPTVQQYVFKHIRPAAFEKIAGAHKGHPGHSRPGKAGSCCFSCSMVAIVSEACQTAVTARQLDAVVSPLATASEQIRLAGLRRPPRSGFLTI